MNLQTARENLASTIFLIKEFKYNAALKFLAATNDPAAVDVLVENVDSHPRATRIALILDELKNQNQKNRLWELYFKSRNVTIGDILRKQQFDCTHADLIVFSGLKCNRVDGIEKTPAALKAVLDYFVNDIDTDIKTGAISYIRALPKDQTLNDILFFCWLKTESVELEKILIEQKRYPGTGAKETLFYLVTGNAAAYLALNDTEGEYFYEAFTMASKTFRTRINTTIMSSKNSILVSLYTKAMGGSEHFDIGLSVEAQKQAENDDELFKLCEGLNLTGLLDLLERWSKNGWLPSDARKGRVVREAVAIFNKIGSIEIKQAEDIPKGTVDMFTYWKNNPLSKNEIPEALKSEDPLVVAHALSSGYNQGTVMKPIPDKGMWVVTMINTMFFPGMSSSDTDKDHHVCWLSRDTVGIPTDILDMKIKTTPDKFTALENRLATANAKKLTTKTKPTPIATPIANTLMYPLLQIVLLFQKHIIEGTTIVDHNVSPEDEKATIVEDTGSSFDLSF